MENKNKGCNEEDKKDFHRKDLLNFKDGDLGERFFIRNGESYKEVTTDKTLLKKNYHRNKQYHFRDLLSFIDYCNEYGEPTEGIIFVNPQRITMYLNEENREEYVRYEFSYSQELILLLGRDGQSKSFSQKDLHKCLSSYPASFEPTDILPKIQSLKISSKIDIQSEIGDNEHKFLFQERGCNQTCALPKEIILEIPYFEGSNYVTKIKTGLEIIKPQSSDEKVRFVLENTYFEKAKTEALELEINFLKDELKGWNFFKGIAG